MQYWSLQEATLLLKIVDTTSNFSQIVLIYNIWNTGNTATPLFDENKLTAFLGIIVLQNQTHNYRYQFPLVLKTQKIPTTDILFLAMKISGRVPHPHLTFLSGFFFFKLGVENDTFVTY